MSDLITKAENFARVKHRGQRRKYTGDPYATHCLGVARLVAKQLHRTNPRREEIIAAAWCHDILEDTETSLEELAGVIGHWAAQRVLDCTDRYTPRQYPYLNRADRKSLEAVRYLNVPYVSRLIKRCDIEHNLASFDEARQRGYGEALERDQEFIAKYCLEKAEYIRFMDLADRLAER